MTKDELIEELRKRKKVATGNSRLPSQWYFNDNTSPQNNFWLNRIIIQECIRIVEGMKE